MKFLIVLAFLVAAAVANPIQVSNNNLGDIVTVELTFNGILSSVVDDETVNTNVGISRKDEANDTAKLMELLLPIVQDAIKKQPNEKHAQPEAKVEAAIESLIKKLQEKQ